MKRVSVVGNSGSGKSRLAGRVAEILGVSHVELDAIHHLADWEPMDPGEFLASVEAVTATESWVIDGNSDPWWWTDLSGSGPTPSCGSICRAELSWSR